MRSAGGLPCPNLTRALTPGTRRLLQPLHVYRFREAPTLMLNLSLMRLARAAWAFAIGRSFEARATADSVRCLTASVASRRAALRAFTLRSPAPKVLTLPPRHDRVKLNFVLAEAALELVPRELLHTSAVSSDAKRRGVDASGILLDRSLHHSAMSRLRESEKRGRPDLVHEALLSVTGTPLYLDGSVKIFVHTCQDIVLELAERTRIPKNYFRFRGLVEKLLAGGSGEELVDVYSSRVKNLIQRTIAGDKVFGLSVQGGPIKLEELAMEVVTERNPCIVVGGFPHGHFTHETLKVMDELVRINDRPMEAHVVAARVVYEVEKAKARINH